MRYSISFYFNKIFNSQYLSMKIKWEKGNIEPIQNFAYTTEVFALGKALLARLYLHLKVFIILAKCLMPYMK